MEWQPIDTAPKDGTHVLAFYDDEVAPFWDEDGKQTTYAEEAAIFGKLSGRGCAIVAWIDDKSTDGKPWWSTVAGEPLDEMRAVWPTHWMPLPEPPK